MSSGYAPCFAFVIERDALQRLCPIELLAFEHFLKDHKIGEEHAGLREFLTRDDPYELTDRLHEVREVPYSEKGEIEVEEILKELGEVWVALKSAFTQKTTVRGKGLNLHYGYHDSMNDGSCYDEIDGQYYSVGGMQKFTPAGEKFRHLIEERGFASFG